MKGLLIYIFLSMKEQLLIATIFLAIPSLAGILENNHITATLMLLTTYPFLYIALNKKEIKSWMKLERTFPLSINKIVLSKYISYLLFLVMGFALFIIYVSFNLLFNNEVLIVFLLNLVLISATATIIFGSIYYPISLIIEGGGSSGLFILIVLYPAVHFYLATIIVKNVMEIESIFESLYYPAPWLINFFIALLIYILSYLGAIAAYKNLRN